MKCWWHTISNTRCSWLHGDPRGFRSRGHRIHSSGDYKHPPPAGEHEALWQYHLNRSGEPVELDLELRIVVLREFVTKMRNMGHRIITCSVGARHLHALSELGDDYGEVRLIIGRCKQKASHAIREILPGSIWSEGGTYERINDLAHFRNTYGYIRFKQEAGTVVWSHRDDENWIDCPGVGVIVMQARRKRIRVFVQTQTPASEQQRRPGSDTQQRPEP